MPQITKPELIKDRLGQIRAAMEKEKITVYVVGNGDYHMSEYTGAYFAERQFMSGFTGSAGTLVITAQSAALFTDGRYFVQAQIQLKDTGVELMKQGCDGVPSLPEYCGQILPQGGVIGFDGRTFCALEGLELSQAADNKEGSIRYDVNFVTPVWKDRPEFPHTSAFELELQYAGQSRVDKLRELRAKMEEKKADVNLIASLDDICWLFNIRGNDVACNPVIMAFAMITQDQIFLYADADRFGESLTDNLRKDGVQLRPYEQIYDDVAKLRDTTVLIDKARVNMKMYSSLDESITKIEVQNPTVLMKAIKNPVELQNLREIHVQDGLALTRFMQWLKARMEEKTTNPLATPITELSAAQYLDHLRTQIDGYIELSFPTISASGPNGAMMHYAATPDNCMELEPHGMLLVDSGGQYYQGTTDVTRTFALGDVTSQMKKHFTLTLKGMLSLAHAHFLKGCTGFNLDILARQPLWNEGIDYRCGTGHGIGYLLNVHEAPNGFRWKHNPGHNDLCVIEEGMVTSDEPGVYIEGEYGIRIENEIVSVKDFENEYGTFMKFETLTCAPIDLDLVDINYLDATDKDRLNEYHRWVYESLSPYMNAQEQEFLKKYTREV